MRGAPLPATAVNHAGGSAPTALGHRYPWSAEEITVIGGLSLIPVGCAWLLLRGGVDQPSLAAMAGIVMVCGALATYLVRLGTGRKNRSQITGSLAGADVSFNGGRFGRGGGSLRNHRHVRVRHKGPERALVFSGPGAGIDADVLVPLRLVRPDATGRAALTSAILEHGSSSQHSDEAEFVLQELRGCHLPSDLPESTSI